MASSTSKQNPSPTTTLDRVEPSTKAPILLNATDYGVPQYRKRVFIIGVRTGEVVPDIPTPLLSGPSVEEALGDIPAAASPKEQASNARAYDTGTAAVMSNYVRSLREPYRNEYPRVWNPAILTGCVESSHAPDIVKRFSVLSANAVDPISQFRKLDGQGKSSTLRAGTGRDHGSFTAPRPIHYDQPRVITVREAARLHSFPDWFQFHQTIWHGFRQVGNAVPPRLAFHVAHTLSATLGRTPILPPAHQLNLGAASLLSMSLVEAADYFEYDRLLLPKDPRPRRPRR